MEFGRVTYNRTVFRETPGHIPICRFLIKYTMQPNRHQLTESLLAIKCCSYIKPVQFNWIVRALSINVTTNRSWIARRLNLYVLWFCRCIIYIAAHSIIARVGRSAGAGELNPYIQWSCRWTIFTWKMTKKIDQFGFECRLRRR